MEQALVFISIVLGVAVAFELENLNRLIRSKQVKWHWAQPLFALFVLMTITSFWWMVADRTDEEPISLAAFMPLMWILVILNLLAAAALPDKIGEDGVDLAAYYQDNRRYLWGLYLLVFLPLAANWIAVSAARTSSFGEFWGMASGEFIPLIFIILLFFAKRWWLVGVGFAGLSTTLLTWMTRTL
ncbi:hypothetical protein [Pseudoblastomonas halimionae]|uniref:Uncharacterized protein n=1 Tax=Alteriqipengyuania halimionae TaxID=1926630 RepID=A0A6I4TZX0_9SPHN|nr:hypothetical protein [Alteriqipengyuania halimionae]MXP09056.1 hypothetical protein [Alteriqipengyuania halimionae]